MFYKPDLPVRKHLNHLPHWQQDSVFVFITWRLADSVPIGLMEKWREDREKWVAKNPRPWDAAVELEYHQRFSSQLEEWMDQGIGKCILRNPEHAKIVAECLLFFDKKRFQMDSFVVMPNHVHVLLKMNPEFPLEKIVQSWKRVSARKINEMTGETGSLWHRRYWDRLVRSEEHFWKIRRYIQRNPQKAGLAEGEYLLYLPWDTR